MVTALVKWKATAIILLDMYQGLVVSIAIQGKVAKDIKYLSRDRQAHVMKAGP